VRLTLEIPEALRPAYAFERVNTCAAHPGGRAGDAPDVFHSGRTPEARFDWGFASRPHRHVALLPMNCAWVTRGCDESGRTFQAHGPGGTRTYLALACGSGITPVLSILTSSWNWTAAVSVSSFTAIEPPQTRCVWMSCLPQEPVSVDSPCIAS